MELRHGKERRPGGRRRFAALTAIGLAAALSVHSAAAEDDEKTEDKEQDEAAAGSSGGLVTLEDLRKALEQGETAPASGETQVVEDEVAAEDGADGSGQIITLEDLRQALTGERSGDGTSQNQPAETETAGADPEGTDASPADVAADNGADTDSAVAAVDDDTTGGDTEEIPTDSDGPATEATGAVDVAETSDSPAGEERSVAAGNAGSGTGAQDGGEAATSSESPSIEVATLVPEPAPVSTVASPQPVEPAYVSDPENWVCKISTSPGAKASTGFDEEAGKLSLYFASAEFALEQSGIGVLAQEAKALQSILEDGDRLVIIGTADGIGNSSSNIILSLQRAYNVKACIMQLIGIEEQYLTISGHGNFSPILEGKEPTEAGNRRVDIMRESEFRRRFEEVFAELNGE